VPLLVPKISAAQVGQLVGCGDGRVCCLLSEVRPLRHDGRLCCFDLPIWV
jgi:hypothetical protein